MAGRETLIALEEKDPAWPQTGEWSLPPLLGKRAGRRTFVDGVVTFLKRLAYLLRLSTRDPQRPLNVDTSRPVRANSGHVWTAPRGQGSL
jgi:hypothetical protein